MIRKQTMLIVGACVSLYIQLNGDSTCISEKVGLVTINNQNDHEIKLIAPPEPDPYDCTKCTDPQVLKNRMRFMPQDKLLDNLVRFSERTRMQYLSILSTKGAQKLLQDIEKFNKDDTKRLLEAPGAQKFLEKLRTKAQACTITWADILIAYLRTGSSRHIGPY